VEIAAPGFKYNFMDLQAAIGLHQLASLEEFNERRRALASLYDTLLGEVPEIERPAVPPWEHRHARHLFMTALKERGVGTGLHFRAVHTQPYYAHKYPEWTGRLPHTERASERICSLPLFPLMTDDDVGYVVAAIRDVLAHPRG
jgi:dTDP-4-amino-4,6-dideoxygalactose transaminase